MRTNPYGQALTLEEYRELELTRPLTDPHMTIRRAWLDARHSRLIEPTPRNTPAKRQAAHRQRQREDAA